MNQQVILCHRVYSDPPIGFYAAASTHFYRQDVSGPVPWIESDDLFYSHRASLTCETCKRDFIVQRLRDPRWGWQEFLRRGRLWRVARLFTQNAYRVIDADTGKPANDRYHTFRIEATSA